MRIAGTRMGGGAQLLWVVGVWLAAMSAAAYAQSFDGVLRPPSDVPSMVPGSGPTLAPSPAAPNSAAPKGPMLQSLPPSSAQLHSGPAAAPMPGGPAVPAGQGALAVSARFGRDLPAINGGLHWRVYRTEQNGVPRIVKEEKGPAPTFVLPPGAYVVNVGFGL